jgi:hypothetical protein
MGNLLPTEAPRPSEDVVPTTFDTSPDTTKGKTIVTIHGNKGGSKTTTGLLLTQGFLGLPGGNTAAISFDDKTKITKEQLFPNENITVYDGKRYFDEDPKKITVSGYISYKYLMQILYSIDYEPDWIMFDGLTILSLMLEQAMRFQNNLRPTQGVANLNVWKDRKFMLQALHNLAVRKAKYGVIYTTYSEKNKIIIDGNLVTEQDVPVYIDIVMQETDVVLYASKLKGKDGNMFYYTVESTKYRNYTGYDGKPLLRANEILKEGRLIDTTGMPDMPNIKPVYAPAPITDAAAELKTSPEAMTTIAKTVEIISSSVVEHPVVDIAPVSSQVNAPITNTVAPATVTTPVTEVASASVVKPTEKKTEEIKPAFEVPDLFNL